MTMADKLHDLMEKINRNNQKMQELEKEIDKIKNENSEICKDILPLVPSNKFLHEGEWFLIKARGGRHFIVNFGNVEPGSWRRKKVK